MKKKNKIFLLFLLIVFLFIFLFIGFFTSSVINIKKYPNESIFFQQIVIPGEYFTLKYSHSVAQTPVWEIFKITKKGQLTLTETHFYDHGAGLPYTAFEDEVFVQEDSKFKIKNMSREILLPLYIRIGKDRDNYFSFKNHEINLSEKHGDAVLTIDIAQMNLFEYFLNKFID